LAAAGRCLPTSGKRCTPLPKYRVGASLQRGSGPLNRRAPLVRLNIGHLGNAACRNPSSAPVINSVTVGARAAQTYVP
jgi:hypothetical protein